MRARELSLTPTCFSTWESRLYTSPRQHSRADSDGGRASELAGPWCVSLGGLPWALVCRGVVQYEGEMLSHDLTPVTYDPGVMRGEELSLLSSGHQVELALDMGVVYEPNLTLVCCVVT